MKLRTKLISVSVIFLLIIAVIFICLPMPSGASYDAYFFIFRSKYFDKRENVDYYYEKAFAKLVKLENVKDPSLLDKPYIIFNPEHQISKKTFIAIFVFDDFELNVKGDAILWNDGTKTFNHDWRDYTDGLNVIYYSVENLGSNAPEIQ
jgi:hypothetical protein